jgi:hypothetical protein
MGGRRPHRPPAAPLFLGRGRPSLLSPSRPASSSRPGPQAMQSGFRPAPSDIAHDDDAVLKSFWRPPNPASCRGEKEKKRRPPAAKPTRHQMRLALPLFPSTKTSPSNLSHHDIPNSITTSQALSRNTHPLLDARPLSLRNANASLFHLAQPNPFRTSIFPRPRSAFPAPPSIAMTRHSAAALVCAVLLATSAVCEFYLKEEAKTKTK